MHIGLVIKYIFLIMKEKIPVKVKDIRHYEDL